MRLRTHDLWVSWVERQRVIGERVSGSTESPGGFHMEGLPRLVFGPLSSPAGARSVHGWTQFAWTSHPAIRARDGSMTAKTIASRHSSPHRQALTRISAWCPKNRLWGTSQGAALAPGRLAAWRPWYVSRDRRHATIRGLRGALSADLEGGNRRHEEVAWRPPSRRKRPHAPDDPGLSRDRCPWNVVGRIEKVRGYFDVSTRVLRTLVRRVSIRR
jgi:hypothetical protein